MAAAAAWSEGLTEDHVILRTLHSFMLRHILLSIPAGTDKPIGLMQVTLSLVSDTVSRQASTCIAVNTVTHTHTHTHTHSLKNNHIAMFIGHANRCQLFFAHHCTTWQVLCRTPCFAPVHHVTSSYHNTLCLLIFLFLTCTNSLPP